MTPRIASILFFSLTICLNATSEDTPALPDAVVPAPFGVNIHFVVPNPDELDKLAKGGFGLIRMDFPWAAIEKKKGEYEFSGYDKLVDALQQKHIRPLFILDYGNSNYDGGVAPRNDESRAAFARFAAASAKHFAGKNIIWELWNEPNLSQFWKPAPSADDYAKLAHAVVPAMREADPKAIIVGPASSTFAWDYMEVLGKQGALALFDAVSVHPYRQENPETVIADWARLRALLTRYVPTRHVPMISGEWGYSTAWAKQSDERQGRYLVRQWLTNLSCGVNVNIWYDWRDDGADPKEPEHHFGTVFRDLQPKPAYLAAQKLVETLRGYRFVRRMSVGGEETFALLFVKEQDAAIVLWNSAGENNIPLPLAGAVMPKVISLNTDAPTAELDKYNPRITVNEDPKVLMYAGAAMALGGFLRVSEPFIAARAGTTQTVSVVIENLMPAPKPQKPFTQEEREPQKQKDLSGAVRVIGDENENFGEKEFTVKAGEKLCVDVPIMLIQRDRALIHAGLRVRSNFADLVNASGFGHDAVQMKDMHVGGGRMLTVYINSPFWIAVTNTLESNVLPWNNGKLPVHVRNASGEAARFQVRSNGATAPIEFSAGQTDTSVLLETKKPEGPISATIEKVGGGEALVTSAPTDWRPIVLNADLGLRAFLDGDAKISADAALDFAPAPQPLMEAPNEPALRLKYKFAQGWRFARIAPAAAAAIDGQPSQLGLYIYGDGSGCALRCRMIDSTGQAFQSDASIGALKWAGWRFVTFPLASKQSHWGGANDGVIHPPLKLDTLLIVDSTKKGMNAESSVWIAGPAFKYP
ncbi:MAG TPA: cellulase family glycosylhydrolase [Planctomycetota bacterium]|nr:cellulase family glycosylhydrolase [Planctomycetota bacterium]